MRPEWVFEVSFECGNKVGGIWTVITSKSRVMKALFGDRYFTIGFYNPDSIEIVEKEPPEWLLQVFRELEPFGLGFRFGEWVDAKNSQIILIDSHEFQKREINRIKAELWEKFGIDSLGTGFDYDEPLAWSYATGMLLEKIAPITKGIDIAHFHEWLSGAGLLYLKSRHREFPTVFTTHATVLGRALSGPDGAVSDPDQKAKELGVLAKHMVEKASAQTSDIFTTVSDLTAEETTRLLGRKPDAVTYNALDIIPDLQTLLSQKIMFRERLNDFLRSYFMPYYPIHVSSAPIIYTAGRYEFYNKGFDIFIDALGKLNEQLKSQDSARTVFALILVPAGTLGFKDEVVDNFVIYQRMRELIRERMDDLSSRVHTFAKDSEVIRDKLNEIMLEMKRFSSRFRSRHGKCPPLCASRLSYDENSDAIVQRLKGAGLLNREEDRVKVLFYPIYLNREDELLGMSYFELITAGSMGVFPSRYEPWGYTTMESASRLSVAVTTDRSGFGRAVNKTGNLDGIMVLKSGQGIIDDLARTMMDFAKLDKDVRLKLEISAYKSTRRYFVWPRVIRRYIKAYDLAVKRALKPHPGP